MTLQSSRSGFRRCSPTAGTPATPRRTTAGSSTTTAPPTHRDQRRHQRQRHVRDESARRALPAVRGRGAISTWNLSLPVELRSFDYMTISDVILHIRYTARDAGRPAAQPGDQGAQGHARQRGDQRPGAAVLPGYDFLTEWSAFVNDSGNFTVTLDKQFFPYSVQGPTSLTIEGLTSPPRPRETIHPTGSILGSPAGAGRVVRAVRRAWRQHRSSPAQPADRRHRADLRPDPAGVPRPAIPLHRLVARWERALFPGL